jgi:hypothetical protein
MADDRELLEIKQLGLAEAKEAIDRARSGG